MLQIIKKANRFGIPMVIDEAYNGFYPLTYIKKIKKYSNLIICRTFSKNFGLAGLRVGYIASSVKIIDYLRKFKPMYEVNNVSVIAASLIIKNMRIVKQYVKETNKSKNNLKKLLKNKKINFFQSKTNFLLFEVKKNKKKVIRYLNSKNILISDNSPLQNYLRVTVGPISSMKKFYKYFKLCIDNLIL